MTALVGSLLELSKGLFLTLGFLFAFFLSDKQLLAAEFNVGSDDTTGLINSINSANSNSEADTINLATGSTYTLTSINNVTYSNNGLPVITSEIVINGYGSTVTRNSSDNFRIFAVVTPGKLTINNLTIKNGYDSNSSDDYGGGGVFNLDGSLVINESTISNNMANVGGGGGIWLGGNTSTKITKSNISLNYVNAPGSGGALLKRGLGLTEIIDSEINDNYAQNAGGAAYSGNNLDGTFGGTININQTIIKNNSSQNTAGAIYKHSGYINIINSCILGNSSISVLNNPNTPLLSAQSNFWGDASGPSGVGPGTGDSVSSNVDFSNWLDACPPPPSPSPSPEPSILPSPSPSPSPNTPIVFLPGMGGSWNTADLISGNSGGIWKKTPFIKVYDNLKNTFLNAGYSEGDDYFEFYYDWRQPVDNLADQLNDFINNKFGPGVKINLVGHSLGGLVSRAYGQKYGENKINQLVTAGSPHQGAILPYLLWSGAQINDHLGWDWLGFQLLLHLHQGRFTSPVNAVRSLGPSLENLLPVFDFAKNSNNEILPIGSMETVNDYLNQLANDLTAGLTDLITTITGNETETIEWVRLEGRSMADRLLDRWKDGRPADYDYTNAGDGTVLSRSALLNNTDQLEITNSHQDLVQTTAGIESILSALGIDAEPQTGNEQPTRNPGLFFLLHSPAEITVTAPDGNQAGFNVASPMPNAFYSPEDKLLLIYNASAGNYQTEITGTGNGEYQLDIGQLTDEGEFFSSLIDTINLNSVDNWTINFNPAQPLTDPVIDESGESKIAQARLRLQQLKLRTKPKLTVYLNQILKLLDKNRLAQLRLALSSTYKFRYWVDKFAQSDAYLKNEVDQIGQLLSQALVTTGRNSQTLTKKQVQAELNASDKAKQQLETKIGQVSGENHNLGNTLELINRYFDRAQTSFSQNNFWQTHADALVVRVLAIEAKALIK